MRESCRITSLIMAAAIATSLVSGNLTLARAQSAGDTLDASNVARAQHFLHALYPDLNGKYCTMTLETEGGFDLHWRSIVNFTLHVSRGGLGQVAIFVPSPGPVVITPIVSAHFGFVQQGQFTDLAMEAPDYLSDAKNAQIRKLVDSHQSWTDEQVVEALKTAGAKFGPTEKDTLIAALPVSVLEPLIGSNFKIETAEFKLRASNGTGLGTTAALFWEINFVTRSPEGKPLHWWMSCEPFGGKPTTIGLAMDDRLALYRQPEAPH